MPIAVSAQTNQTRSAFFDLLFGTATGYVCVATLQQGSKSLHEEFFQWPAERNDLLEFVNRNYVNANVYFCPQLLAARRRIKENVKICTNLWADLDECDPELMLVEPSVVVESSPNRWQAYWLLESPLEPEDAEEITRRIAYHHAPQGADKTGWDLTQLLRVPLTYNMKRGTAEPDVVAPRKAGRTFYRPTDFSGYPQVEEFKYLDIPMPTIDPDETSEKVLTRHRNRLLPQLWKLMEEPEEGKDWSSQLWQMEMVLFESGLTREEVFVVALEAPCNKFKRDGRNPKFLWQDVCRAWHKVEERAHRYVPKDANIRPLLTDDERAWVESNPTFVERYVEWASTLGDAAWQYHQAGAFIVLSSLLAGSVKLPTSYGIIVPNLWFMILADTTLTRKSTAMDIAMDLVMELDSDSVLATDGSIEGLLTSMSTRPGRPSIFLRDEFSGLLEQMTKKDYMAGMPELLTKLYDGKFQKRVLRKESIEVKDPILIVFAGGIKNRICQLLSQEHVTSGFMPRFCFITAESDVTRLKPLGPPGVANLGVRDEILADCREMYEHYHPPVEVRTIGGQVSIPKSRHTEAHLTTGAWQLYNKYEAEMVMTGVESEHPDMMTPTYDRLAKSGLKASVLLAASRQRGTEVVVEEQDILRAFYYVEIWRTYVHEVLNNIGKSAGEKELDKIYRAIARHPGTTRSNLMQGYHLTARDADQIFRTLEERGMITVAKQGRTQAFYAVEVNK